MLEYREYFPGEALPPGATIIPGPGGQPIVVMPSEPGRQPSPAPAAGTAAPPAPPRASPEQKKEPESIPRGEVETHPLKPEERGFTAKPDWKPVEYMAEQKWGSEKVDKSKPTVYEDKEGTRYYTPNSTMWQMGYKTDKEYYRAERVVIKRTPEGEEAEVRHEYGLGRIVDPAKLAETPEGREALDRAAPYVAIATSKGHMHITRAEARELLRMDNPDDAAAELHNLLGIPEEAPALPMDRRLVKAVIKGELNLAEYVEKGIDDPEVYRRAGFDVTKEDIQAAKRGIKEYKQQFEERQKAILDEEETAKYKNAKPEDKFSMLMAKGSIPIGSQFVGVNENGEIEYLTPETIRAKALLEPFKNKDDSYNILDAMMAAKRAKTNREDLAIQDALKQLFPSDVIERVRKENLPVLTIGEKGSVWSKSWDEARHIVPESLLGVAGFTKQTPIPQDDMVALVIIAAITGGITAVRLIKNFRERNDRSPSIGDIYVVKDNKAVPIDPDLFRERAGIRLLIPPKVEFPTRMIFKEARQPTTGETLVPPKIKWEMERVIAELQGAVILTDPAVSPPSGFLTMQNQVRTAYQEYKTKVYDIVIRHLPEQRALEVIKETEKALTTIPQNEGKQKEVEKVFNELSSTPSYRPHKNIVELEAERRIYNKSHNEYLRRLAIWKDAWRSQVASVNPQPIRGEINNKIKAAIVMAKTGIGEEIPEVELISGRIGESEVRLTRQGEVAKERELERGIRSQAQQKVIQKISDKAEQLYQNELKNALKVYGQTYTKTQLKSAQQTALKQAIQTAVKQATKTQTQTLTKMMTQTALKQAVRQAVRDATRTAEKSIAKTAETTAEIETTITDTIKYQPPSSSASEKKKREYLEQVPGFTARRRGALHGQDMWLINYWPYGKKDRMVVLGKTPEGAKRIAGKGSMQKTAVLLKGQPPTRPIYEDTGAVDDIISARGRNIIVRSVRDKGVAKL